METYLAQAQVLFDTRRFSDAEAALRQALAMEPDHAHAHALLAYALYRQDTPEALSEAARETRAATGLDPEHAFAHYVLALVRLEQGHIRDSLQAIHEALRLNPEHPGYYATLANIYIHQKAWRKARSAAETGLRYDPEHVPCLNLRAMALVNLGRAAEAGQTLASALNQDPENPLTHANQGWACLHRGDSQAALSHFREALRLNPLSGWARAGIVEALKARNPIYKGLLRYFLWLSRLTEEERAGLAGIVYGVRVTLNTLTGACLLLRLLLLPLELLYDLFIALTWVARPLFALLLRFDRFGRQTLPREEIVASNWMAACLWVAGSAAIAGLLLSEIAFLVLVLAAIDMLIPVAGVFMLPRGKRRLVAALYVGVLAGCGLLAFLFVLPHTVWASILAIVFGGLLVFGRIWYPWVILLLSRYDPNALS
ncbi:MAG: tetratricopeptide repeat protein [Anaerolineae bacterium]|nr:tetratricopeptide repeat protein [Anaerolineae bacterium]